MKAIIAILLIASMPAMADVQCRKYPDTTFPPKIVTFGGTMCPVGWQPI